MKKISISNFNKINLENIILGSIKTKDDCKLIEIKYKDNDEGKAPCLFKIPQLSLVSSIKESYNKDSYIECLITDLELYNFVLRLEDHIKTSLLKKSKKLFSFECNKDILDDYLKTNIRLNIKYKNPIIKLIVIEGTKNNDTLVYDSKKNEITLSDLNIDDDFSSLIKLNRIKLNNYIFELEFIVEQVKLINNKASEIIRTTQDYNFDDDTQINSDN
tara:strand:+ start:162 stop:812 length:651 start_codon:yes stop_codon:yes gene_type:complete